MAKQEGLSEKVLDMWRKEQCPDCRAGNRSKCHATRETAKAYRIDENGKTHYYCFLGCLLLEMSEEGRKAFTESQYNVEGHYEQLRNEMDLYADSIKKK